MGQTRGRPRPGSAHSLCEAPSSHPDHGFPTHRRWPRRQARGPDCSDRWPWPRPARTHLRDWHHRSVHWGSSTVPETATGACPASAVPGDQPRPGIWQRSPDLLQPFRRLNALRRRLGSSGVVHLAARQKRSWPAPRTAPWSRHPLPPAQWLPPHRHSRHSQGHSAIVRVLCHRVAGGAASPPPQPLARLRLAPAGPLSHCHVDRAYDLLSRIFSARLHTALRAGLVNRFPPVCSPLGAAAS